MIPGAAVGRCTAISPIAGSRDSAACERLRFAINVLTRLRFCTPDGRIDFKQKGKPDSAPALAAMVPGAAPRQPRCAHRVRSLVGARIATEPGVVGLDTGCVWGGALTAVNLDEPTAPLVSVPSRQPRSIED